MTQPSSPSVSEIEDRIDRLYGQHESSKCVFAIKVGFELAELKAAIEASGAKNYEKRVKQKWNWDKKTATNKINAAKHFGHLLGGKFPPGFDQSGMYELAAPKANDAARKAAIDLANQGVKVNQPKAKELIAQYADQVHGRRASTIKAVHLRELDQLRFWADGSLDRAPDPYPRRSKLQRIKPTDKLFLDSGAHSYAKNRTPDYFDSPDFQLGYVERYGRFLQEQGDQFDLYASCDCRPNPDAGYMAHLILRQKFGLAPVPCVHAWTKPKQPPTPPQKAIGYLQRYLALGDRIIALGGLDNRGDDCIRWLDAIMNWVEQHAPDL